MKFSKLFSRKKTCNKHSEETASELSSRTYIIEDKPIMVITDTIPCDKAIQLAEANRVDLDKITNALNEVIRQKVEDAQGEIIKTMINRGNELIEGMIKDGFGHGASGTTGLHFDVEVYPESIQKVKKHFEKAGYKIKIWYNNYSYCSDLFSHTGEIEITFP